MRGKLAGPLDVVPGEGPPSSDKGLFNPVDDLILLPAAYGNGRFVFFNDQADSSLTVGLHNPVVQGIGIDKKPAVEGKNAQHVVVLMVGFEGKCGPFLVFLLDGFDIEELVYRFDHLPFRIQFGDNAFASFFIAERSAGYHISLSGDTKIDYKMVQRMALDEFPGSIEDMEPSPLRDIDSVFFVDKHPVRRGKLARPLAFAPDGLQEIPIRVEFLDASVPGIQNEKVVPAVKSEIGNIIELFVSGFLTAHNQIFLQVEGQFSINGIGRIIKNLHISLVFNSALPTILHLCARPHDEYKEKKRQDKNGIFLSSHVSSFVKYDILVCHLSWEKSSSLFHYFTMTKL